MKFRCGQPVVHSSLLFITVVLHESHGLSNHPLNDSLLTFLDVCERNLPMIPASIGQYYAKCSDVMASSGIILCPQLFILDKLQYISKVSHEVNVMTVIGSEAWSPLLFDLCLHEMVTPLIKSVWGKQIYLCFHKIIEDLKVFFLKSIILVNIHPLHFLCSSLLISLISTWDN